MKKIRKSTLLKKYLSAFIFILAISFLTLGVMLYFFMSSYRAREKKELLTRNLNKITRIISQEGVEPKEDPEYTSDLPLYRLKNKGIIKDTLKTIAENIGADIFVTDVYGKILLCADNSQNMNLESVVPSEIINKAKNGQYTGVSTVGSVYSYDCYTVGLPIRLQQEGTKDIIIGAVFISSNAQSMNDFGIEVTKLFLLAALIACVVAAFVIWYLSYRMVRPLKNMTEAVSSFGNGDFSQRVNVKSNDELGDLAQSVNKMADSLEISEKVRRNFIANVSHELKTPMTTISGFVDGIIDGTIAREDQLYYLNIVSGEVKRLSRLVKSMLNLSKIDDDEVKLHKTNFEMLSLTLNVLALFENKINEKNIQIQGLENSSSVYVNADYDMIYQVIFNLLENAVKFVEKNGYIKISIAKRDKDAVFSVSNSGEGISKDELDLIFDKFYKTDKSRSKDKIGIGLGLYIVKRIVNLHKGHVKAESIENKECNFEFYIPL